MSMQWPFGIAFRLDRVFTHHMHDLAISVEIVCSTKHLLHWNARAKTLVTAISSLQDSPTIKIADILWFDVNSIL